MMSAFASCALFLMSLALSDSHQCAVPYTRICPGGWHGWSDYCYLNLDGIRKRDNATRECQERGARLATPNSVEEYVFMWGIFVASQGLPPGGKVSHGVWIGCTDIEQEGEWVCDGDSSETPYRAEWHAHDESKEERDCAVMSVYYPLWVDQKCGGWKYAMCERPMPLENRALRCFVAATGRCLHGHSYETVTVKTPTSCCVHCNRDWRCRSFNVKGNQCQLSNATRSDTDDTNNPLIDPECAYYDVAVE